jgi:hypothetical protein
MLPFRYIFDPLFIASLALYALNHFLLKPHFNWRFLHDHLNDLLCIPVWVPVMLLIQRTLKLRSRDDPPRPPEVLIAVVCWSWMFEVSLPGIRLGQSWCTPDPVDITCYALGGIVALLIWNSRAFPARSVPRPVPHEQ